MRRRLVSRAYRQDQQGKQWRNGNKLNGSTDTLHHSRTRTTILAHRT